MEIVIAAATPSTPQAGMSTTSAGMTTIHEIELGDATEARSPYALAESVKTRRAPAKNEPIRSMRVIGTASSKAAPKKKGTSQPAVSSSSNTTRPVRAIATLKYARPRLVCPLACAM